jgi:hypothetical protein
LLYNGYIVNERENIMMKIFALNAGGMYAIGTAVVAAPDHATAVNAANAASNPKWGLTYHGIMTKDPIGVSDLKGTCVLNIHEWGMPDLPSKGSGKKVTF